MTEPQPTGEREAALVVRNTFLHLEPVPSPSARPARRCSTAPEALLAAALESGGLRGHGEGDSSWAHSWEGEPSDGGVPEGGSPECHGDAGNEAVSDGTETRVTIKNTFLHLEPVEPEFHLRTARRNKTAPEILLAAAFKRDTHHSKSEGCAEGLENGEEDAPTRAPSLGASSAASCETDDAASVCTVGEDMSRPLEKNKKDKHGGLRDSSGRRPGKRARERYQNFVASLQDMVRQDPSLSLESLPLPQWVLGNEMLSAKLVARVEEARSAVW
jgi:hypothetical protein